VVTDSVEEIIDKAKALAEELGVRAKVFVSGKFRQLALKEIAPVKFARSGMHIELDQPIEGQEIAEKRVNFIGDYNQRKYKLKTGKRRPRYGAKKADTPQALPAEQPKQANLASFADKSTEFFGERDV
jgi:hypothetical protein